MNKTLEVGTSSNLLMGVEGTVEAFVFAGAENQKWSLVDNGPPSQRDEEAGEAIVSPSRFNVLSVSEDEECEIEDTEEGELVDDDQKAKDSKITKKGGKGAQTAGAKNSKRRPVNTRDLKLKKMQTGAKKTSVRKL